MQFFQVKTPDVVLAEMRRWAQPVNQENIALYSALGRVLAADVYSPEDLPDFNRAIMDGYAVRAQDTFGASSSLPAYLDLTGEVRMGEEATCSVQPGEAVLVATGSMLPVGADAVVMVENTDSVDQTLIEIHQAVAPWENVVRIGEDTSRGEELLVRGHRMRSQDVGALAGLGVLSVMVHRKVKVGIISTGDEIVSPEETPKPGQIRDINSYSLAGLVEQTGAHGIHYELVRDSAEDLEHIVTQAADSADVVLVSGGSSVGTRDVTLQVLESFPGAEVFVHGVSIRPGKPVIGARTDDQWIFGLPGNPVSVMVVFERLIAPLLAWLSGESGPPLPREVTACLTSNYASDAGREDHVRVRLIKGETGLLAEPVLGKSALITTMVRSDGVFVVPVGVEGVEAGEQVAVRLF